MFKTWLRRMAEGTEPSLSGQVHLDMNVWSLPSGGSEGVLSGFLDPGPLPFDVPEPAVYAGFESFTPQAAPVTSTDPSVPPPDVNPGAVDGRIAIAAEYAAAVIAGAEALELFMLRHPDWDKSFSGPDASPPGLPPNCDIPLPVGGDPKVAAEPPPSIFGPEAAIWLTPLPNYGEWII